MGFSEVMDNQIDKVSERDLFNFVFFYELLSDGKKEFLNNNNEKYGQIRFYKKLKENLMIGVDNKIKENLAERISAYKKKAKNYKTLSYGF